MKKSSEIKDVAANIAQAGFEGTSIANSSRRTFLQGAVTLSVVAAGGFALNLSTPGSAEAMARTLPKKWDETIDVVIVGSGFAGLAAAAEAGAQGSKVIILEKRPTYGGNSIINGGEFNCTNQPGATGEMIRYAHAVGADTLCSWPLSNFTPMRNRKRVFSMHRPSIHSVARATASSMSISWANVL